MIDAISITYRNYTLAFHHAGPHSSPKTLPAPTEETEQDDYPKGKHQPNTNNNAALWLIKKMNAKTNFDFQCRNYSTSDTLSGYDNKIQDRDGTESYPKTSETPHLHRGPIGKQKKRTRPNLTATIFCKLDADLLSPLK